MPSLLTNTNRFKVIPCKRRHTRNRVIVRTVTNEEIPSLTEKTRDEAEEAILSLRRILARQEADLEATKKLITSLQEAKRFDQGDVDISNHSLSAAPFVMGFDYGFVSRSEGAGYSEFKGGLPGSEYGPPANVWKLGWAQFWRNLNAMKGEYKDEPDRDLSPRQRELQAKLESLTLDSKQIWKREQETGIEGPWIVKAPYLLMCWLLDVVFEGQNVFSRFFLLETVARMPYFSYIGMLHLYETLGKNPPLFPPFASLLSHPKKFSITWHKDFGEDLQMSNEFTLRKSSTNFVTC